MPAVQITRRKTREQIVNVQCSLVAWIYNKRKSAVDVTNQRQKALNDTPKTPRKNMRLSHEMIERYVIPHVKVVKHAK